MTSTKGVARIRVALRCLSLLIFGLNFAGQTRADECIDYRYRLHWAGGMSFSDGKVITGMTVSGTTVFMITKMGSFGGEFRPVDASVPSEPAFQGYLPWSTSQPSAVVASGTRVYVTDSTAGLTIVDVTDLYAPKILKKLATPNATPTDLAVEGSTGYLAEYAQGLKTVNLTDPLNPVIVGGVDTPGGAVALAASGGRVYVIDDVSGLQVIDVSSPSSPVIIGSTALMGSPVDVEVSGSTVYVAGMDGVQVIDVSNPTSPITIAALPGLQTTDITLIGTWAYLAGGPAGILQVDISQPSSPVLTAALPMDGAVGKLQSSGPMIFATNLFGAQGYQEFDTSYPLPVPTNSISIRGGLTTIISGSLGYLSDGQGLQIVDVSDPESPALLGTFNQPGYCEDLAVSGNTVYLTTRDLGLQILDASDPINPVVVGSIQDSLAIPVVGIKVQGNLAYVCWNGLKILDISNPEAPEIVGSLSTIAAFNVTVSGTWAYATFGHNIAVIDVSNPASPHIVATKLLPSRAEDIAVLGTVLYVSTESSGIQIIDASNPSLPVIVGTLPLAGSGTNHQLSMADNFLYAATASTPTGIAVLDVTNPLSPLVVANIDVDANSVFVSGDHLYFSGSAYSSGTWGTKFYVGPTHCLTASTGSPTDDRQPQSLLGIASPNPVLGRYTKIHFSLARSERVRLEIVDLSGRTVRTLLDELIGPGERTKVWDGRNESGQPVPAGVYFYRLLTPEFRASNKLVWVR